MNINNKIAQIEICEHSCDWKDAIKQGVQLLANANIATMQLADEIIASTEKLGPYYVLMPNVALAHAQHGPYNKTIGMSLIVFKQPVVFSGKHQHSVQLLFTLSAIDGDSHMQILQNFANVINNNEIVDKIINSPNKIAIYELVKDFL